MAKQLSHSLCCLILASLFITFVQANSPKTTRKLKDCKSGWLQYNDKCFRVLNITGTFGDADDYCEDKKLKSRTITIRNEEEQRFLEQLLYHNLNGNSVWLGAHRENLNFVWRNDHIIINGNVYQNWATDAPSYIFPKACLQMNSLNEDEPAKWKDQYCFARNAIACEYFRTYLPDNQLSTTTTTQAPTTSTTTTTTQASTTTTTTELPYSTTRPTSTNSPTSTTTELPYSTTRPTSTNSPTTTTEDNDDQSNCCKECMDRIESLEMNLFNLTKLFKSYSNKTTEKIDNLKIMNIKLLILLERLQNKTDRLQNEMLLIDPIGIQHNFTGIAYVFNYVNERLDNLDGILHELINNNDNNNDNNNGNVDLDDLKDEISKMVDKKLKDKDLDKVVNDIRLKIVNYRRTLQFLRDGDWHNVGNM